MQQYPNDVITTIDDDVFYRSTLVRDLVKEHTKRKETIICTRSHKIRFDNGKILPYLKGDYETRDRVKSSHYLLATGVGVVLYPANSLPKYIFNMVKSGRNQSIHKSFRSLIYKNKICCKYLELRKGNS